MIAAAYILFVCTAINTGSVCTATKFSSRDSCYAAQAVIYSEYKRTNSVGLRFAACTPV